MSKKPEAESEIKDAETGNNHSAESETPKKGGAPSGTGSEADLAGIASDLSATFPEVQEHALNQEKLIEEGRAAKYAHLKDSDGNSFDPAIHKTNKEGEPTLSTKGKLIKKPGRKPGQSNTSQESFVAGVSDKPTPQTQQESKNRLQARASGTMTANLLLQIGIVAGGEEWHPRSDPSIGLDEKKMLEDAFADYFEATGKTDLPPGLALTVAVGAYALPRFTMPKTRSRLGKAKDAIKKWWITRKLKKHGLKAEPIEKDNQTKMAA
jgi:hypothetical protein